MRKEHVEYLKDLPINIHLANIMEYPIHWKDSIEILFVLKGSIKLGVETETYELKERQIEIVNSNEVFWMKSDDPDNLVLIINIDPNFFEKYYDDAKEIFFYTDSSNEEIQENETYYGLRRYLSILLFEAVSKLDDYEDMVEDNLLEMMYYLLNNFHYLYYEAENLEEDEALLERYHRIDKYISNNYMYKVSLQDIAEKEFLSSQYLSYKIKDTFGLGFNDYLNKIRVEESTKLLLTTDRSVSDISEEVGFSHIRYYNKHFKLHYNMTPSQYRKKHKVSEELLEKQKKIIYKDVKEAIPYLKAHLEDYERYNYDNKIIKLDFDLEGEMISEFNKPDTINLGNASLLLEEENRRLLEDIQFKINFKYAIISNLFSDDMDIYRGKNNRFINWTRVENILDFMLRQKITPIIGIKGVENHIVEDFISNFSYIYNQDVSQWLSTDIEQYKSKFLKESIHPVNDTIDLVPYIIFSYTHENNRLILKMIDDISKDTVLDNDTFYGGDGIFTNNYLNKPTYYALMLLSLLGEEIIYRGEGYIVTKSDEGYQLLLFNPTMITEEILYDNISVAKPKERKISINLYNMSGDFQITKYDLNKSYGSSYDKWTYLGKPERIDNWHWELLKEYVHPNIRYFYGKKSMVFNIRTTVKPNGVVLYILNNTNDE